jgi:prepilin-type N-terminal cleavage/methylation domain-containing protein
MSFIKRNKPAFTLMEISVSLFIIVILLSLVVVNYNAGYSGANLISGQEILFQNMKLAQSQALSYRSYDNILPKYWGVYLEAGSSEFFLFADMNENGVYDVGEANISLGGRQVFLSVDTEINYLSFDTSAISVLFESGTGRMFIYDVDSSAFDNNPWLIELKDKRFNMARVIVIDPPTRIEPMTCSCYEATDYCCSFCAGGDPCIDFETSP